MTKLYTEETEHGSSYEKNFWSVVEIIRRPKFNKDKPINHSWVFDPLFTDQHTYGLELNLTPEFSMKFILMGSTATYTKEEAFIAGIKFRDNLRVRFPGIGTKVYLKSMKPSKINKRFWEVKLPSRGNFYNADINIFQKLINFIWLNQTKRKVVAYIFWKRDPNHKNYPQIPYFEKKPDWIEKNEKHLLKYYKLRILINVDLENTLNLNRSDLELKGQLETLASGIQNSYGHGAVFVPVHQKTWYDILNDNYFEENHIAFINPKEFDFIFSEDIPLKKSLWLEDENVELEPYNEKDSEKISLGSLLYRGNLTNHKKAIKINHLHQRVLIVGNNGVGKTSFIIDQLGQINSKFKQNHDIKFYSEPKIYPGYPNKAADGLILNNEEFLQKRLQDPNNTNDISKIIHDIPSNSLKDQFNNIKAIQFDFTNNITDENIIEKSLKYQNPDLMLYIVGTKWYPYDSVKTLPKHEGILYPDNIKVICHDLFAEFIGLQADALENYEQIIDLNYNGDVSTLKSIHNTNRVEWNDSTSLKKDLREKKLIRKSMNEYFQIPLPSDKKQKKLF